MTSVWLSSSPPNNPIPKPIWDSTFLISLLRHILVLLLTQIIFFKLLIKKITLFTLFKILLIHFFNYFSLIHYLLFKSINKMSFWIVLNFLKILFKYSNLLLEFMRKEGKLLLLISKLTQIFLISSKFRKLIFLKKLNKIRVIYN